MEDPAGLLSGEAVLALEGPTQPEGTIVDRDLDDVADRPGDDRAPIGG